MYICIYVYMSICVYVYMYICIYVYMYICVYVYMYICIYVYMYIKLHLAAYNCRQLPSDQTLTASTRCSNDVTVSLMESPEAKRVTSLA